MPQQRWQLDDNSTDIAPFPCITDERVPYLQQSGLSVLFSLEKRICITSSAKFDESAFIDNRALFIRRATSEASALLLMAGN